MKKSAYLLLLIVPFLLSSCVNVEDNGTEPNGIVPYVYNFTIKQTDWQTTNEKNHWFTRLDVPHINEDVIDYGAVLVYSKNQYNSWILMPFTTTIRTSDTTSYTEEIWSSYFLNGVDVDYKYTIAGNSTPPPAIEIKVVVLKDNWTESMFDKLDVKDFESLRNHFNWKEVKESKPEKPN